MSELHQMTLAEVARSRAADPQTSKDAARRAHGLANEHCHKILATLRENCAAMPPHEIAAGCGLSAIQVSRRLHELWAAGLIVELGTTPTPSGRRARCWRLAP